MAVAPKYEIGIIGCFGGSDPARNGQIIKTQATKEAFELRISPDAICCVDTFRYRCRPYEVVKEIFDCLRQSRSVVVLVAHGGRKWLFPILYWANKLFRKNIYHILIGGLLADEVAEHPRRAKYIKSFRMNWVESRKIVDDLSRLGIDNACFLPNFRNSSILPAAKMKSKFSEPLRLCTFSRVAKEKGICQAIEATKKANKLMGRCAFTLDIYGEVAPEFREEFFGAVSRGEPFVRYCGVAKQSECVEILSTYFALVFPSIYSGEGMPGTVIDGLFAGLPILSARWRYYDDILEDGSTGFSYNASDDSGLVEVLLRAVERKDDVVLMRKKCLEKAKYFSGSYVIDAVLKTIQDDQGKKSL